MSIAVSVPQLKPFRLHFDGIDKARGKNLKIFFNATKNRSHRSGIDLA